MWHSRCANKQKRWHLHGKTTIAKLYIYIGVGSRELFIDEAHTALGIFSVFFPCMLPIPLCRFFMYESRPRLHLTQNFKQDRDENHLLMKKIIEFWLYCFLKTTHPDQDETETRLSKIEANETRPRWDCLKIFHPRRHRDETTLKILYETGTRPRVSVLLVSRPRLSPISVCKPVGQLWCYKLLSTVHSWKRWFFLRFCAIFHQMSFFFCGKAKHFFSYFIVWDKS